MKASAVSTITKSLPIALPVLVNSSLLATLGYINLFSQKNTVKFSYSLYSSGYVLLDRRNLSSMNLMKAAL